MIKKLQLVVLDAAQMPLWRLATRGVPGAAHLMAWVIRRRLFLRSGYWADVQVHRMEKWERSDWEDARLP